MGVSIIAEIAQRADVSVEGVMRVLTREPVSEDIKERVLAVLPELSPEQTRVLQRFALAALHDELPRQELERTDALPDSAPVAAIETRLAPILEELVDAIKDLRQEANAERRERVDDLALLVDVITTGWQELDRRLGRVERVVGRIAPSAQTPPPPVRVSQPPPQQISAVPPLETVAGTERPERRPTSRWPVAAALVAGLGIGLLAGLDVLPARTDILDRISGDESTQAQAETTSTATRSPTTAPTRTRPVGTTPAAATTSKAAPTRRPAPKPAPKPATTTAVDSVLGTVATAPTTKTSPSPPVAPRPATTTRAEATRPAPAFVPTRTWGWGPVKGADYYVVDFFRAGEPFYHASPAAASLSLPDSVVFRPGEYRWVVRPGFGKAAAKRLGAAIIDSTFKVAP